MSEAPAPAPPRRRRATDRPLKWYETPLAKTAGGILALLGASLSTYIASEPAKQENQKQDRDTVRQREIIEAIRKLDERLDQLQQTLLRKP